MIISMQKILDTNSFLLETLMIKESWLFKSIRESIIIVVVVVIIITIIIIELRHSKTIPENTVEIESQPVALDFKNLSQYSSCSK